MKMIYSCRCEGVFCRKHLQDHDCQFDYLAMNRSALEQKLPVVRASKI